MEAHAPPPPHSAMQALSQLEPPELELLVFGVGTPTLQRSSATCVQTCCSVWDVRSAAACAHVVYAPMEQMESPQPQTSSEAPALIRKPQ